jgi:hypothetical protein
MYNLCIYLFSESFKFKLNLPLHRFDLVISLNGFTFYSARKMKVVVNAQNNMCLNQLILFQFHFSPQNENVQTHK